MLLINLGIMAGVYAGKRLLDSRQTRLAATPSTLPVTAIQVEDSDPAESLLQAKISGVSVLMVSASAFLAPPFALLGIGVISYTLTPILQRAFETWRTQKKITNDSYSSIVPILLVATGNNFAAAMHNVLYHFSSYLISKSREDSSQLAAAAFHQTPETVWIAADGVEQQVPLEQVQTGDGVIASTGVTIPVDGLILEGSALVDQQALTGEANPLEKTVGDTVMAATIVLSGRIVIQAAHSGAETRISKLNTLLGQTRDYKTQLQLKGEAWANRIALPIIATSAAAIPFVGPNPAMALLFSAPLNAVRSMLSTQTAAHMQGVMRQGVFIKDGRMLEELPHIDTILFDKTGTLTRTHPEVAAIITCADLDADSLLALAAAAEQRLEHPIARAIYDQAIEQQLTLPTVTNSRYELGLGVTVSVEQHEIRVGSQRFIQQATGQHTLPAPIAAAMQAAAGHTFILIAVDNGIQGALELHPRLRPEVPALIGALRQRGFQQLAIVSGDQQAPTERLAAELGLDAAYGEVLPQDKAALIQQLQEQGHRVCFIGDGLNDAIAMKQANVSVCLSSASAITSEVAQILLLNDSLQPLDCLFGMASRLHKRLDKNLYLWIGFSASNAIAVPLLAFNPLQSSLFYSAAYVAGLKLSGNTQTQEC